MLKVNWNFATISILREKTIDLSTLKDRYDEVNLPAGQAGTAFSRIEERSNAGFLSVFGSKKASKIEAARSRRFSLISAIIGLVALTSCANGAIGTPASNANSQVCFGKQCYVVEVVQKKEEIVRGLQFRRSLAPNAGMLFVFAKESFYSFWMKDTLIPLDMIWLDRGQKVVHLERQVLPCQEDPCPTYQPGAAALYVLEINAGEASRIGLTIGQRADFMIQPQEL